MVAQHVEVVAIQNDEMSNEQLNWMWRENIQNLFESMIKT